MRIQIVGQGRMGSALASALRPPGTGLSPASAVPPAADIVLLPQAGRGADCAEADVVLLAVPDSEIEAAAAGIAPGRIVGHLSGSTTLEPLAPHEAFSVHPLLSVTGPGTSFAGAHAAVDGSSERALAVARDLASLLGMETFRVADADRAAYHAAASVASNFLVALEGFAERLARTAGVPRGALVPLARAALRNWAELGAESALTGPIARGDERTVERQRAAVAERSPRDLHLFDALVTATRELAGSAQDDGSGRP